jgi:hypothetical protein
MQFMIASFTKPTNVKSKTKTVQRKGRCSAEQIPRVLFDGGAVLGELTMMERTRTNGINVCDVLDAVVRLMRREAHNAPAHLRPKT